MMKPTTQIFPGILLALSLIVFAACGGSGGAGGGGKSPKAAITGEWQLVNFEKDGSADAYTECDAKTTWHFTSEKADPLGDGTEVMKLVVTAPDDCKFYGFEATWTTTDDGNIFISSTRVGGMGGSSNAGQFEVVELSDKEMTLKAFSNVYSFGR